MNASPSHGSLPFVSVVIPVYNDAVVLERCLDALERQSFPRDRYEVVVVDNNSTEDIAGLCRGRPRVRYLRESSPGSYAARNRGVACAHGDVFAFTDADCVPRSDWLERGVARLLGTPDVGLVGGSIEVFFGNAGRPTTVELYESVLAFPQKHYVEANHYAATANMFTRRSVFERVGPFDDTMRSGGDAQWGRRVHAAGYRLAYAPDAIVGHPARAGLGDIRKKALRVAGGLHRMVMANDRSARYFAYYLARMTYYTLRKSATVMFGNELMRNDLTGLSTMDRARVAFVLNYINLIRIRELVRLRLGAEREPRR